VNLFARPVPAGPPIRVHPTNTLDLARLATLPADLFEAGAPARTALENHTRTIPGFPTAAITADLRQHAAEPAAALENPERTDTL
jgi:hypothetical protein